MNAAAPSCAFLGHGAVVLAAQALRRAGSVGVPLLIRWDAEPPRRASVRVGGRAVRGECRRLATSLPDTLVVGVERGVVAVDIAPGAAVADVIALVREHAGPIAVAVGRPRSDDVDALLRMVDEVVVVESPVRALADHIEEELRPIANRLTVVPAPRSRWSAVLGAQEGQTLVVALAVISTLLALAVGLGVVATALGRVSDVQGRADVAALAGAKALLEAQSALYSQDPQQRIDAAGYRARGSRAATRTAAANGLRIKTIDFVGDDDMPTRIRVRALSLEADGTHDRVVDATAEVAVGSVDTGLGAGDYQGPFAVRQGQRMRPDVAPAFDRLDAAASAAGHPLVIVSAFRSDAEQAVLFARHPDPKWVAPPGKSLHRLGTELDLGPATAYAWLA
ncbi:MAG: D-alanyl-D-alanine carboxypeptidase family protein, partial [Solirubrobacteraceae bacterium]|nr:D-alanyl-D-alanine carboxypeptidase family protein [Patulibacter sp.]